MAVRFYPVQKIRSDKDTHFTGAISAGNDEDENLPMIQNISSKGWITGVRVISDENLNWNVTFWKSSTADDTDADLDAFVDRIELTAVSATRIGGAGLYRYAWTNISKLAYEDADHLFQIHVSLGVTGGSGKTAGANGEAVVEIDFEPVR